MPFLMSSLAAPAVGWAGSFHDSSVAFVPAFFLWSSGRCGAGNLLRIPASTAVEAHRPRGQPVSACCGLWLDIPSFRTLPSGHPYGLFDRYAGRYRCMGMHSRTAAAVCFFGGLGNSGKNMGCSAAPFQKNFKNDKNFICICEKMGYNKVE